MNDINTRKGLFEKILTILIVFCVLAHILLYAFMNFQGFDSVCNSDAYADCQVAKRMWEQKTLFPEGWRFGNQFYVVATPALAALLYGLIGNINTAMILSTELMTVLTVLSFIWLLRSFTRSSLNQAFCLLLLFASVIAPWGPYSVNIIFFFQQASFYACYLITMFVVYGDYIRSLYTTDRRGIMLVLSLLLSFMTGMQSLRQTLVMVLPLLVCELYQALRRVLEGKVPWQRENFHSLLRTVSYGVANLAGVAVAERMEVPTVPIYGEMTRVSADQLLQKVNAVGDALIEITSLDYILQGDFSKLVGLDILWMIGLVFVGAILWLARIRRRENELELCWLLFLIGIAGVCLATVLFNITLRSVYLFLWFPLVAFSGLMITEKSSLLSKYGVIVVTCVFSMATLLYCWLPYAASLTHGETSSEVLASQWAIDNGYKYVYGDYWGAAPGIAHYSQGELDAGCWHTAENVFLVEMTNTPQDIYGEEENRKAVYVFSTSDEEAGLLTAQAQNVVLEKVIEFGDLRLYTSPVPLMRVQ